MVFKKECKFCKTKIKKKDAHVEVVKQLEFVYPKKTFFCSKECCEKYKAYEEASPKRFSTCPSCAVHPAHLE